MMKTMRNLYTLRHYQKWLCKCNVKLLKKKNYLTFFYPISCNINMNPHCLNSETQERAYNSDRFASDSINNSEVLLQDHNISLMKDESLIKSMQHTFPFPSYTLKNFYHLMNNNLNENCSFSCEFKESGKKHSPVFICTLQIDGPLHKVFCGFGSSKKSAEAAACLKALSLLYKGCFMDSKGRPFKMKSIATKQHISKSDLHAHLKKEIPITLSDEAVENAEALIGKYELEVASFEKNMRHELEEHIKLSDNKNGEYSLNLMTGKIIEENQNSNYKKSLKMHINKMRNMNEYSYTIDSYREEIIRTISENPVTIIEGGTGCGKSSQAPQFILDQWIKEERGSECNILISQPRRIAALSLAEWVAFESGQKIGETVGYKMRLDEVMLKENGGIMFYTSGTLREMFRMNPSLHGITHVFVDEVHERSIDTDLLLLLLKRALDKGSSFKVILMSATANVNDLKDYFKTENLISIRTKRNYPVAIHHFKEVAEMIYSSSNKDKTLLKSQGNAKSLVVNNSLVTDLIFFIDRMKPPGAILVFLPGWNEIKSLQSKLGSNDNLWVLPLHSKLPRNVQNKIFGKDPQGRRKVILSTNIAETSLTISDIVYVIDSGLQNDSRFVPNKNANIFGTAWISKANAVQRMGRAGRMQPGEVFRLYNTETYEEMDEFPLPEVLKLPLESVVLRCKSLFENINVRSLLDELIETPPPLAVEKAIESLVHLRAMKISDDDTEYLTPLGHTIAGISTSPFLSKPLIYSTLLRCPQLTLNYIALENNMTGLFESSVSNKEFRELKRNYNQDSDVIAMGEFLNNSFDAVISLEAPEEDIFEEMEDDISEFETVRNKINLKSNDLETPPDNLSRFHSSVCSQRLQNFMKIRNLLKMQSEKFLPEFSGEKKLKINTQELVLASFLSASITIIKLLKTNVDSNCLLVLENGSKILIHKSSVLSDADFLETRTGCLFFSNDLYHSQKSRLSVARDISAISPILVAIFYGEELEVVPTEDPANMLLRIRGKDITFELQNRAGNCLIKLREIWQFIVDYYLAPSMISSVEGEALQEQIFEITEEFTELLICMIKE